MVWTLEGVKIVSIRTGNLQLLPQNLYDFGTPQNMIYELMYCMHNIMQSSAKFSLHREGLHSQHISIRFLRTSACFPWNVHAGFHTERYPGQ